MEEKTLINDTPNSITLKKDSKGNYNWEIKLYFKESSTNMLERLKGLNKALKCEYGGD